MNLQTFFELKTTDQARELQKTICDERPFTSEHTGVPANLINYWHKQGVLPFFEENSWATHYNLVELVWIRVVKLMRDFGFPLDKIAITAKQLFTSVSNRTIYTQLSKNPQLIDELYISPSEKSLLHQLVRSRDWKKQKDEEFSMMQLIVAQAICKREFMILHIMPDGEAVAMPDSGWDDLYFQMLRRLKLESNLSISITAILAGMLGEDRLALLVPQIGFFTENEKKILEIIRSGQYDAIRIRFSEKKMDMIELEKRQDVHRKVVDILAENDYQDVTVTRHGAKTVRITNTVKMKL